jgi:hypothetical protein
VRRRRIALIGAAALAVLVSCGDPYRHTNPYDPVFPVTITVRGPDTMYNSYEIAFFSELSVPAFPDSAVSWNALGLAPAGTGGFQAIGQPLWPDYFTATVNALIGKVDTTLSRNFLRVQTSVWRHVGSKTVIVTQRLTQIQLRCPDAHACNPFAVGDTGSIWVDGFDAHHEPIYALVSSGANPATGTPIAIYLARDPTIVSVSPLGIRAAAITALKAGTTWIVGTRIAAQDTLRDSLQLTVH